MKRKTKLIQLTIIFLLVISAFAGCDRAKQATPTKNATMSNGKLTTPANDLTKEPEEIVSSLDVPEPAEDMCVVSGRIMDKETDKVPEHAIYLAKNITADQPELPNYFSFSHMSSPRAVVDENGFFYFENVPEGQYAIILFVPGGTHIFVDNGRTDDQMDYLWVNAEPNESIDLGAFYAP